MTIDRRRVHRRQRRQTLWRQADWKIIFLLVLIIAVSGCVDLAGIFGGSMIKISKETKEEGFRDILVIKDVKTIPTSPVLPGQEVLLTFVIENRDKEKVARDVRVEVFDPSAFTPMLDEPHQCSKFKEPNSKEPGNYCIILPGEQKQITIKLKAPSTAQIAGMKTPLKISFRVEYVFAGSTLQDVLVVKMDEILARMRQGEPVTLKKSDIRGSGPVQIEAGIKGAEFTIPEQEATFEFLIKSKGDKSQGTVQESRIGPGGFSITFPRSLFRNTEDKGKKTMLFSSGDEIGAEVDSGSDLNCNCINPQDFTGTGEIKCGKDKTGNDQYVLIPGFKEKSGPLTTSNPCYTDGRGSCSIQILGESICASTKKRDEEFPLLFKCTSAGMCWNQKSITLLKGDSIPLLFRVSGIRDISEPYRTFQVRADIQYTYELRSSVDITVNPFTNV